MFAILSAFSVLLTLASPPSWETPVSLVWPFADGVIRSIAIGYGDWCSQNEGPHPGIDFGADNDDNIRNPLNTDGYIIGQWPVADCYLTYYDTEGSLVIGSNLPGVSNWGWEYDHLLVANWSEYAPETPLSCGDNLNIQTNPGHPIFQHLHVYWMWVWESCSDSDGGDWVPGSMYPGSSTSPKRGYVNPFEYLPAEDLQDYDNVRFGRIYIDESPKGIWFSPDGAEEEDEFSLVVTPSEFQDEIFGVVDFAAAPYSAFGDDPNRDSCGVHSVGHQLAWMNPYTENIDPVYYNNIFSSRYDSVLNEGGRDYYRTLVEMSGDLPYDPDLTYPANTDEYRAVYLDGELIGDPMDDSRIDERWFRSAYILSNCGNLSVGSDGWDNIPLFNNAICHHFWSSNVMCVGGWDTRLRRGDRDGNSNNEQAPISPYALFPDGEYLVDVTASSQGTAFLDPQYQKSRSKYLPSTNVDDLNSDPDPVVVDNHIPYVDSIIVYITTQISSPGVVAIYTAGWDENTMESTAELVNCTRNYLPINTPASNLWIAVRYSEAMNTNPGDLWITGEMKGVETWNSQQFGEFNPRNVMNNWPERFGLLETDRLGDGVWYLYEYDGSMPSEYKGRLTINIAATDYGGNVVDGDPSTIAGPRNADGSWSDPQLYEEGPDTSYTWGDCIWDTVADYENETGYFRAMVGNTEVQRVDFSELGFGFSYLPENYFGSCGYIPYNCGVYANWVSGFTNQEMVFISGLRRIKVIDGEGNIIGSLAAPEASYDAYFEMDSWLKPGYEFDVEWENNYLWYRERAVRGGYSQDLISNEIWYVINGHTGVDYAISARTILGGEYSEAWYNTTQYFYVNCNNPNATYTGNGWSTPVWYIVKNDPIPYYRGGIFIPAPANDQSKDVQLQLQENESIASSTPQYIFSLRSVFPNPVTSSATISYSLADTGAYNLAIYDVSGRNIATLSNGNTVPGNHSVVWDISDDSGTRIPSGIYYVRLQGCGETAVQSLVVLQ